MKLSLREFNARYGACMAWQLQQQIRWYHDSTGELSCKAIENHAPSQLEILWLLSAILVQLYEQLGCPGSCLVDYPVQGQRCEWNPACLLPALNAH